MKRKTIILLFLLSALLPLFSDGLFSFQLVSDEPLYEEGLADPYGYSSHLHLVMTTDSDNRPNRIDTIVIEHDPTGAAEDRAFYALVPYDESGLKKSNNKYVNMKTAISVGLLRVRFEGRNWIPSIDAELNLAGYINDLFNAFSGADCLDFDGSYFFGGSLRFADTVTFRFGLHHFSGHYGDEILEQFYSYNNVDFTSSYGGSSYLFDYAKTHSDADSSKEYYLAGLVEYVRDNSWLMGLSADLPWGFRVYGEAELPQNPSWLRPFIHVPADYRTKVSSDTITLIERIGNNENIPSGQKETEEELKRTSDGTYKAWRIHFGLEWKINIGFGAVFLAADLQFHQDGQTKHQIGAYSRDNPWEYEITAGGGLEIGDIIAGRTVRIEAYYHNGRVGATQWFYQRMSSVTVGLGIN